MARLFLATLLSEANISSLQAVRNSLVKLASLNPDSLRWTIDSKLHLTWLFLGSLNEAGLIQVQKSLKDFPARNDNRFKTPTLSFDKAEIWHSHGVPRHLVLTPSLIPLEFDHLAAQIRDSFLPFVEDAFRLQAQRAPRPHVTLAHFKKHNGQEPLANFSPPLDNHPLQNSDPSSPGILIPVGFENPLTLRLSALALIESSNDGATNHYRTIETLPIGHPGAS